MSPYSFVELFESFSSFRGILRIHSVPVRERKKWKEMEKERKEKGAREVRVYRREEEVGGTERERVPAADW